MNQIKSSIFGNSRQQTKARLKAFCLFAVIAHQPLSAELPMIQSQPWLGHFVVYESKRCQFKITSADGKTALTPVLSGAPVGEAMAVPITFAIAETLPDGKTALRPIRTETLESADPATAKLDKCTIRGKTEGDATLEITFEQVRGIIMIGGRVSDPGTLTNPTRISITATIPDVYPAFVVAPPGEEASLDHKTQEARKAAKKAIKAAELEAKAIEKRMQGDCVRLTWTDGKKLNLTGEKVLDIGSKEINGSGISATEVKIAAYGKSTFHFTASPNSAIKLSNSQPASLTKGFSIQWSPSTGKNEDGNARLAIEVR